MIANGGLLIFTQSMSCVISTISRHLIIPSPYAFFIYLRKIVHYNICWTMFKYHFEYFFFFIHHKATFNCQNFWTNAMWRITPPLAQEEGKYQHSHLRYIPRRISATAAAAVVTLVRRGDYSIRMVIDMAVDRVCVSSSCWPSPSPPPPQIGQTRQVNPINAPTRAQPPDKSF